MTDQAQPAAQESSQSRSALVAFGHLLSFFVMFVVTAEAAEHSGFANASAAFVCGLAAIVFTRLYVRIVMGAQRAIQAWQWPNRKEPVWPSRIPLQAVLVYAAIGLAFIAAIARDGAETRVVIALLVVCAAGCNLLNYLWTRRTQPGTPEALEIVDGWLAAKTAQHRTASYTLSFLLVVTGASAHAFESGFAATAVAQCGPARAIPASHDIAALLCGLAVIVVIMLYATIAEGARWLLVDSWKHVRPGPPPSELPSWVIVLHILIGFAVFFAMTRFGMPGAARIPALGHTYLSFEDGTGRPMTLDGRALLEMALAWWIGGCGVLKFFWLRRRATR